MLLYSDRAKWSLHEILKVMRVEKAIDVYWIERIDKLRLKRNPLVHFKDVNHEQSISQKAIIILMKR